MVLLFQARSGPGGPELFSALSGLVPACRLLVARGWQEFADSLHRLSEPARIVIIWNPTHDDLRRAADARDLLRQGRTLLALPDQSEATVLLAHRLLPAFITYVEDGNAELLSVVAKLMKAGSTKAGL